MEAFDSGDCFCGFLSLGCLEMHACDGDFFFLLLGFVLGCWLVSDNVLIIVSLAFLAAWQMVKEAIGTLKERTGSSQYAIAKYLEDMYKTGLPPNFKKILSIQLRNMTKQGKVYKVKNSFKLSDELKKPVKAPKAAMAIKDSSKEIKAHKPTKVAKKASSRVKSKTANGALSKAVKLGGGAAVAKPTKVPKSPKAPKSVKPVDVKPPRKAPVAASKSKDEEKVTAPSAARKPAASLTNKPTAVKKTASKKKVGTPRKAPKSVKSAKSKSSKSAVIPGKISKTVPSPAKRAKK